MGNGSSNSPLEERRLALEEKKLEGDLAIRRLELDLKAQESGWLYKLFSPLTTTLLAGILTLAASAIGAFISGMNTLDLEREKSLASRKLETQKQQHELVLKMISVETLQQAKDNLAFLEESGLIEEELAAKIRSAKATPLLPPVVQSTSRSTACGAFVGAYRREAKLSIATAPLEHFKDLAELLASLPSDAKMRTRVPPISSDSLRIREEERNVRFRGFIYAASREDSNDYRLIIGPPVATKPETYVTAVISALPPAGNPTQATLRSTCTAFSEFFQGALPGSSYDFYDPPILVEIEGSLLANQSGLAGRGRGPSTLRSAMNQIWDIRPITKITFDPKP